MRIRALSLLSAVLLFGAVAAGCGGSPTAAGASCGTTPGVSSSEVDVGLIYPDTGALAATFQTVRAGLDARLGAANAAGGVNGRRIHYIWADDRGRLDTNGVVSRNLVENKKVFAVLESTATSTGGAAYLHATGVPVIGIAAEPVWAQYRNMFTFNYSQIATSSAASVTTFGKYAQAHGGTRALVVSDPAGLGLSANIAKQLESSFQSKGIPVVTAVADETPSQHQIDQIIHLMTVNKVDTLVSPLTTETFVQIVAAVRRKNINPKVIISSGAPPGVDVMKNYGPLLAGITFYNTQPADPRLPAYIAYEKAMAAYAPELQDIGQVVARVGYLIGDMVVRGLQTAGTCPTRSSFITGLRAVRDYTAGGLISAMNFEADFGKMPVCYPFVAINSAGDGVTTVDPNFCGERVGA
ncbi:ABC transporter substrate-binding protein [Frankia sp. AiPs1]|uniref:ABC transporter substrate-binding protein n=1 Tax=Frankia sp. AiPa1 TaxID=573492 RepID=UPI00202AECD1|nr:ABC transporter substrate-binding protein [Frankia sp. AiPa1]MCL9759979.1 ABC transporter substrate-binding protein [Frankia sp. AiPa1]